MNKVRTLKVSIEVKKIVQFRQGQKYCSSFNKNMSLHSSFQEQGYLKDFREELKNIKSPYMQKIKASAQTFQTMIKKFEEKLNGSEDEEYEQTQQKTMKTIYYQKKLDSQQNVEDKENEQVMGTNKQMGMEKIQLKNKRSELPLQLMKEWTGNNKFSFNTMQEVKENFINVFNKKLGVGKKPKRQKRYDFKYDQKQMIYSIFDELQSNYGMDKGFVNIEQVIEFFRLNQLFYLFYNIHPNQLKYLLKQSARTKPNSLTKKQFLYVFIMDRPLLKDLSDPFEKVVHRKCVLDADGWEQLKAIFMTLDTFGNETIHIKPFIQKLKNCHTNPNLIYTPVIEFPEIERVYTLKKVVFDLEHKFQFDDKITWQDIRELIYNFNHKQEPTLDIIFQKHLEQATILLDSNYFLIEKRTITVLKHIFQKCPKFSDFFVNTKFLCNQLLESHDLKMFYNHPIREKTQLYGGYNNLEETIRSMNANAPQYLDLDEFLQFFSIKGSVTNVLQANHDSNQTSQAEEQTHDQRRKMLRKIRSLEKLQISRKHKKAKRPVRQLTDFQEFNLTKKQKQTIREKKVKQMIKQKQQNEQIQLRKQFRANPIPADINPERIKQQQRRMEIRRKKKLQQVAERRQEDKELMNYLRANTKLFEPLIRQSSQEKLQKQAIMSRSPVYKFTHKPVPWFVQENMLTKIQREKSQRKQQLYESTKIKYARSWNKLPDFFFRNGQKEDSHSNSIIDQLQKNDLQKGKIIIKANPVPDFNSLHKQFQQQIQKKKQSFQPTKVQQFRLTSPKPNKMQNHSQFTSPQQKTLKNSRWRQTLHSPPSNKIFTTKKTQEWMELNKKMLEQKRIAQQQEKKKEKERIQKQKNFSKFMSKKLRQAQKQMPNLEAQTVQKLNKHKQTVQYLQKLTQQQMQQMYARVLQRPFLFETATGKNQKKKARKKGDNKKKMAKKAVIKNIEPIDMSEQTTNKQRESHGQQDGDNYEADNNYVANKYNHSKHQALNQSF